ncbi:MAG: tyrosine-type recombinase/integrase [Bacteroidia bacterium]
MFLQFKDKYEEYFKHLEREGRTSKTISEHKRMLCDWFPESFKNKWLSRIRKADTAILKEAGRAHGEHGETRAIVAFRRYADFLQSELQIKLPFDWRDVKVPLVKDKEQPVFEDYELATLFNVMETMEIGSVHGRRMSWTMQAFFEGLFGTGLRMHEALSLKRTQYPLMLETRKVKVLRKGKKECEVSVSERAIQKIGEYLDRRNDTSDAMFVNSCGEPLRESTTKSYFQRLRIKLRKLGFEEIANKLRSHTFRRSLATYMLEHGADIKAVQTVMDHVSARTTLKHYIRKNKNRAHLLHQSILSKLPFEELAKRYKENNGIVSVRTTENGGRWMELDQHSSNELSQLVKGLALPESDQNNFLSKLKEMMKISAQTLAPEYLG